MTIELCAATTLHPGRPGSSSLYRRGCRCQECTIANRDRHRRGRERRRAALNDPNHQPHPYPPGLQTGYIPVTPELRHHLDQLLAVGWAKSDIGAQTGLPRDSITGLVKGDRKYIHQDRAAAALALRPDDATPLDFIDWVVVERLTKQQMHWRDATKAERRDAAARMFTAGGRGWDDICEATGLNSRVLAQIKASVTNAVA